MGIKESEVVSEVLRDLAENTRYNYKSTLKHFMKFVNSRKEESKLSIDDMVTEARSNIGQTQERIDLFYRWLLNEEVEGYPKRGETLRQSSAHQRAYGYLRGFFVNLDIAFEKKWKRKIPKVERVRQAIKKDNVYTFYDVDEKTMTIRFNRERMQQFLANLKLRDVAITLALLSSSQDSGDLLNLNIGDIREQKEKGRIFWEGSRGKSKIPFRTFISKEATRFIRKYVEQERRDAKDDNPLFVHTRNGAEQQMTPSNLSSIYRDAARKMGIKWDNGEQNPLRPKRMRHLFRTACDTAGINELYTNAFMGHRNNQGQDYSEVSKAKLELEYLRVEPFLTVYGEVEESLEIKEDVKKLESRIVDLNRKIEEQKETIDDLSKFMQEKVEEITSKMFWKLFAEIKETDRAEQELREKRSREFSDKSLPKHREEQSKQASREPSFHELIYPRNPLEDK